MAKKIKNKNMREIKFRGLRTYGNGWIYGDLVHTYSVLNGVKTKHSKIGIDMELYEVIPETVSQYTGLLDKSWIKIFEGDIIVDKDKNTAIVVWIEEWAMFGCMFHDEWELYMNTGIQEIDESMFWTFPIENREYKVIGNIHENSDLFSESPEKADA